MGVNYNSDKMEARDLRWAKGKKNPGLRLLHRKSPAA